MDLIAQKTFLSHQLEIYGYGKTLYVFSSNDSMMIRIVKDKTCIYERYLRNVSVAFAESLAECIIKEKYDVLLEREDILFL